MQDPCQILSINPISRNQRRGKFWTLMSWPTQVNRRGETSLLSTPWPTHGLVYLLLACHMADIFYQICSLWFISSAVKNIHPSIFRSFFEKNLVKVFQENISLTERSYPNCVPDGVPAAGVDAKFRTFACSAPYQESKLCKKVWDSFLGDLWAA